MGSSSAKSQAVPAARAGRPDEQPVGSCVCASAGRGRLFTRTHSCLRLLGGDASLPGHTPASDTAFLMLLCPHQRLATWWPLKMPKNPDLELCVMLSLFHLLCL